MPFLSDSSTQNRVNEKYENILLFHFPSDTAALVKIITWHALSCFFNTLPFNLHLFESLAIGHGRRWVVKDHDKNPPGRRSNLVKMFMIRHFKFKGCSENRKCCFSLSTTYSTLMNLVHKNESDEPLFFAQCHQPIVLLLMCFFAIPLRNCTFAPLADAIECKALQI